MFEVTIKTQSYHDGAEERDWVVRTGRQLRHGVVNDEAYLVHTARGLEQSHGVPQLGLHAPLRAEREYGFVELQQHSWCVVFTLNQYFYPTSVHQVSVLIPIVEIQIMRPQTVNQV